MKRKHAGIEDLENPTQIRHHRDEWWFERIGWVVMILTIAAAIAGLLGPGPLSAKVATGGNGAPSLDFYAVEHYASPGRLIVRAPSSGGDTLRLTLSRSFCDRAAIESIVPPPTGARSSDDGVTYTFAVTGAEPVEVIYRYKYEEFGVFDHRATLNDGEPVAFRQYVLP